MKARSAARQVRDEIYAETKKRGFPPVSHPYEFDATGDYNQKMNYKRERSTCAWEIIPEDRDHSGCAWSKENSIEEQRSAFKKQRERQKHRHMLLLTKQGYTAEKNSRRAEELATWMSVHAYLF